MKVHTPSLFPATESLSSCLDCLIWPQWKRMYLDRLGLKFQCRVVFKGTVQWGEGYVRVGLGRGQSSGLMLGPSKENFPRTKATVALCLCDVPQDTSAEC